MNGSQSGWSWFERGVQSGSGQSGSGHIAEQDDGSGEYPDLDRELRVAYARCFATPEGEKVLKHLRGLTLERTLGPDAKAPMLRHLEGQRQLVSSICAWVHRGRHGN